MMFAFKLSLSFVEMKIWAIFHHHFYNIKIGFDVTVEKSRFDLHFPPKNVFNFLYEVKKSAN